MTELQFQVEQDGEWFVAIWKNFWEIFELPVLRWIASSPTNRPYSSHGSRHSGRDSFRS